MERPICVECLYHDKEEGTCHRNAPGTAKVRDREAWWPKVAETDWCGEHSDFPTYIASKQDESRHVTTPPKTEVVEVGPNYVRPAFYVGEDDL